MGILVTVLQLHNIYDFSKFYDFFDFFIYRIFCRRKESRTDLLANHTTG